MKLLIPILLALVGIVGGAGAGWYLKPAPPEAEGICRDSDGTVIEGTDCGADIAGPIAAPADGADASQFIMLDRQFIVPLITDDRVSAMMVLTLNLEVAPGRAESAFRNEPRLRDALLRALFDHAYSGGFSGDFTAEPVVRDLRRNLLDAGRQIVGPGLRNVLIADMIKQEQ